MPQQRGVLIELATDLAPDLPPMMGAESEIRDALTNLIFNAVDAMPRAARSRCARGRGTSARRALGPRDQVEVSDTGVGMDEETRQRCLEPFFTTKGERGTGLGLAMVYGMMQRHSADIEIDSALGRGHHRATGLPAARPRAHCGAPTSRPVVPQALRLLLVDDDPLILQSLQDVLTADGHVVTTARRRAARHRRVPRGPGARRNASTVVITDLGMPYVDGRQVAAAVKALFARHAGDAAHRLGSTHPERRRTAGTRGPRAQQATAAGGIARRARGARPAGTAVLTTEPRLLHTKLPHTKISLIR